MTRKEKKKMPVLEGITISAIGSEGNAVARHEDFVIFVPFGAPGDVVDIQLTKKKRNYAEGRIVKTHSSSPLRETPFCSHFSVCGGCRWQHIRYDEQLKCKAAQVSDNILRIGKIVPGEILPALPSLFTKHYRNKLEYTFTASRWLTENEVETAGEIVDRNGLGFHIPGRFDKVLDIRKCWLQDDITNEIRLAIKDFCLENEGYTFYDLRLQTGFMRNMIVRNSASTGEVMLILVFAFEDSGRREAILNYIAGKFDRITSLLYVVNGKCNDSIADQDVHLFKGKDHITEYIGDLSFRIGAKSFYQTNSKQAQRLYETVGDFAAIQSHETVYDLYTGAGTIACFLSRQASKVIGIEYVEQAVEDARINASLNKITNTEFFSGDMKDILTEDFIRQQGHPDVIITDPPRAGMHADVVQAILFAAPARIVYVSCNPATQARDLALLSVDYEVKKIQPVDMFPHTQHVENVALLTRIIPNP
jgi:23S rRNA (uracil1939-C5)-methyltransferase